MGLMLSCGTCCGVGFGRHGSLTSSAPCGKPGADQRQSRSIHVTPKSELEPLFVGQMLSNSWCWETSSAKRCLALVMMSLECQRCPVLTPSHQFFFRDRKVLPLRRDSEGSSTSESSYPPTLLEERVRGPSVILLLPRLHMSLAEQSFSAFFKSADRTLMCLVKIVPVCAHVTQAFKGDKIGCQPLQLNIWVERISKNYSPTDEQNRLMAWLHHISGLFSFNSVSLFNNAFVFIPDTPKHSVHSGKWSFCPTEIKSWNK